MATFPGTSTVPSKLETTTAKFMFARNYTCICVMYQADIFSIEVHQHQFFSPYRHPLCTPHLRFRGESCHRLGTAGDFAILTKTGITTTGVTSVTGDMGVSPIEPARW